MKHYHLLIIPIALVGLFFLFSAPLLFADDTSSISQEVKEATAAATTQDTPSLATVQKVVTVPDSTGNLYANANPYSTVPPVGGPEQYSTDETSSEDENTSMVKMRGNYGMSMGFRTDEFIWKEANGDWQEKNFRYFSGDQDVNTYDPRIFDRYELEIETDTKTPWNGYCDIVMDPWSFVQVSRQQKIINVAGSDNVDVTYKAWENTGYTINQMLRTSTGKTIFIPEQKVIGNQVTQFTGDPVFWGTGTAAGPNPFVFSAGRSTDLEYIFRPVRKLWVEYNESPFYLKIFPISNQDEALTSDDPLILSNNHVYYAPSPWLWRFDPGMQFMSGDGLPAFGQQPAMWNWDEAWFAEDSNRHYLTFLRGVSAGWNVEDFASLNVTCAPPLGLWDTYETVTSVPIAARFKMNPGEKLAIGSTYTSKYGIAEQQLRAQNHVLGGDVTYNIWDKTDIFGEIAGSLMNIEHADRQITKDTGESYKVGVKSRIDFDANNSLKSDAYFAYMSEDFSPGLADYRDTREDRDWGRHIWFDPLSPEDQSCRIGDGIDINRYTVGANARAKIADNFFDVFLNWRNVHDATEINKFVENTTRAEVTCNPAARVQVKGLALVRNYHDSIGGYDPLLRNRYTDQFYFSQEKRSIFPETLISAVDDGKDVNIMTFSGGAKVDVIPQKVTVYGIYEATNDPQDFPRQLLNNPYAAGPHPANPAVPGGQYAAPFNNIPINSFSTDYTHDNVMFNQINNALYGQDLFSKPPYDQWFNMIKACITVRPVKEFQVKYTHVTNTNHNYAALFDNNHTHDEVTAVYNPFKGVTWTTGCSISRVNDLARAVDTSHQTVWPFGATPPQDIQYKQHTNIYSQVNWDFKKDQRLTFQFGESWFLTQGGDVFSPQWFSQSSSVLDTRAIFRVWYQGKF